MHRVISMKGVVAANTFLEQLHDQGCQVHNVQSHLVNEEMHYTIWYEE